jgi:hypothetical protein
LLACHTFIHLIRAIGHHIVRLACRSVSIMGLAISLEGPGFTRVVKVSRAISTDTRCVTFPIGWE